MSVIAFSGSHRSGKTTLASMLSEQTAIPFYPMGVSNFPVWENSGIGPAESITFAERVEIQGHLIHYMENALDSMESKLNSNGFITDRSPLDLIAYLLANVDETCSRLYNDVIRDYVDHSFHLIDRFIDHIIILPPADFIGMPVEHGKNGKVYNSFPYKLQIDLIIRGLGNLIPDKVFYVPQESEMFEFQRVSWILKNVPGFKS